MTTNGSALRRLAQPLADAGLRRVTVSLDSLDDATFQRMNGIDFPVAKVLDGIDAAVEAGLGPVKVNVVLKRGENDGGILDLARWARDAGHVLRFIEYMDVGTTNGWRLDEVVPAAEVVETIGREWPLEAEPPTYPGEVAERWRYADGGGEIGVIASVTRPFCGDCTRARISAEGKLYTCLFSAIGHDLRGPLRAGRSDAELGGARRRRLGRPRRPLLGASRGGDGVASRRSRCSRSAAEPPARAFGPGAAERTLSTTCPQVPHNSWTAGPAHRAKVVDNPVDTAPAGRHYSSCPKGPPGLRDRDHIKGPPARAGRFGRFCTRSRRRSCAVPGRPGGTRSASRCRYSRRARRSFAGHRPSTPGRSSGGPHPDARQIAIRSGASLLA